MPAELLNIPPEELQSLVYLALAAAGAATAGAMLALAMNTLRPGRDVRGRGEEGSPPRRRAAAARPQAGGVRGRVRSALEDTITSVLAARAAEAVRRAVAEGRVQPRLYSPDCPDGEVVVNLVTGELECLEEDGVRRRLGEERRDESVIEYDEEDGYGEDEE